MNNFFNIAHEFGIAIPSGKSWAMFSLIITTPNKFIKQIHHRMPVILDFEKAISFLNNEANANLNFCIPYDDKKQMEMEEA